MKVLSAGRIAVCAAVTAVFLLAGTGLAQAADDQVVVSDNLKVVQVLSLVVGVFLPILVGLVTKVTTSPGVKSVLLAFLSVLSAGITTYINDTAHFSLFDAALTALMTFTIAVATHYGLWKPTGVSAKAQAVGS